MPAASARERGVSQMANVNKVKCVLRKAVNLTGCGPLFCNPSWAKRRFHMHLWFYVVEETALRLTLWTGEVHWFVQKRFSFMSSLSIYWIVLRFVVRVSLLAWMPSHKDLCGKVFKLKELVDTSLCKKFSFRLLHSFDWACCDSQCAGAHTTRLGIPLHRPAEERPLESVKSKRWSAAKPPMVILRLCYLSIR